MTNVLDVVDSQVDTSIEKSVNPWNGITNATYLYDVIKDIEELARQFSELNGNDPVYARYNPQRQTAELYTRTNGPFIDIEVRGECGIADQIIFSTNLSGYPRMLLRSRAMRIFESKGIGFSIKDPE